MGKLPTLLFSVGDPMTMEIPLNVHCTLDILFGSHGTRWIADGSRGAKMVCPRCGRVRIERYGVGIRCAICGTFYDPSQELTVQSRQEIALFPHKAGAEGKLSSASSADRPSIVFDYEKNTATMAACIVRGDLERSDGPAIAIVPILSPRE
jgi:hypothetical protein